MMRWRLKNSLPRCAAALLTGASLTFFLWVFGPLLRIGEALPLEDMTVRPALIAVLWGGISLVLLWGSRRDRRRDAALLRDLSGLYPAGLSEIGLRSKAAGRLYERPWYLVLGSEGVGKTTVILNSGLGLPPGDTREGGDLADRDFRIWRADEAVLIETTGRDLPPGLAAVLKKHRSRQPVNGVILTASLPDLIRHDAPARRAEADALRRQLGDLQAEFGLALPVWVLFTGSDLIAGFTETFEASGTAPPPLWGFTLPLLRRGGQNDPVAEFDRGFDALLRQLSAGTVGRLAAESDPERCSLIVDFPAAMAVLRPLATGWLGEVFAQGQAQTVGALRGAWLSSGGGGGRRVDPLRPAMLQKFGVEGPMPSAAGSASEPLFLNGLFQQIILPEAGLVSAGDRAGRRGRWVQATALAAALALSAGLGWPLIKSYLGNQALVERIAQQAREAEALIPQGPVTDSDLAGVIPVLDRLSRLPGNPEAEVLGASPALGLGLYQGDLLQNDARLAYRNALNRLLLPRLLLRLEEVMQSRVNEPGVIFPALKVALMLGQAGPLAPPEVFAWFAEDMAQHSSEELTGRVAYHLGQLIRQPMERVALNAHLVGQMRGVLTRMPQAQRIYDGIVARAATAGLPPFRLQDAAGHGAAQALLRPSGAALSEGISGLYTRQGFHQFFLPAAADVAMRLQRDAWVLGPVTGPEGDGRAYRAITRDVLGLYYQAYIARYEGLLGDLDISAFESPAHAVEVLGVLSQPASPLRNLMNAIARETWLTLPDDATAQRSDAAGGGLSALPRRPVTGRGGEAPGAVVENHFRPFRELLGAGGGRPSPLDLMIADMGELHRDIPLRGAGRPEAKELLKLDKVAAPVSRWSAQIREGVAAPGGESLRAALTKRWQREVLPLCRQVTSSGYPFVPGAGSEVSLQDFAMLFGAKGKLESFFQANLAPFVETRSEGAWRSRPHGGTDPGFAPAVLEAFRQAAQIREVFFASDPGPEVTFRMTPHALDPKIRRVVLESGGTRFTSSHGETEPAEVTWPGPAGHARVTLEAAEPGSAHSLSREGPWALMRLMAAAEMRSAGEGETVLVFRIGGRAVSFTVKARGASALPLAALMTFRCPQSF
ncbi:type VI secretion system membrane subunit TssM [Falsigemmobacter faecalis]|uniref:Type VI secretion system membrane subunit TssM n=1 Tax=Falsigemmobacter faecalis TaxID=2488730 RepID=A0A3P3DH01_9RHOB|nr:type VI secretion system membrane subunit TssM [Falsigemmobacter faecalis]RRH73549.1 type VI secretion system membrane subunit TssM [Falsigemmobacter faecalis]